MSWQSILKGSFSLWLIGDNISEYEKWQDDFANRKTAFDMIKDIAGQGQWTVEGDEYGGRLVVYDGMSMVLSAPTYDYQIIPEGEKPNKNYNPVQEHEVYSPRRTLDRLEGEEFEDHGEEFRERNI